MRDRYLIDRMRNRNRGRNYDYASQGNQGYQGGNQGYQGGRDSMRDYRYDRYYDDYERDYHYAKNEFNKELQPIMYRLSKRDRFNSKREDIINKAKQMNMRFDDISEDEFLTAYYIVMSEYGDIIQDAHTGIAMAKAFLYDDNVPMSPSDKLATYIDCILKGNPF